jgi:hypothetical protein
MQRRQQIRFLGRVSSMVFRARMPGRCRVIAVLLFVFSGSWAWAGDAALPHKDQALLAAFLVSFASYASWPDDGGEGVDLVITVPDAFDPEVVAELARQRVRQRPILVRTYQDLSEVSGHVILVTDNAAFEALGMRDVSPRQPVLWVGIEEGFCELGGIIRLDLGGEKPSFEVNRSSAEGCRMKLSARMLQMASRIHR